MDAEGSLPGGWSVVREGRYSLVLVGPDGGAPMSPGLAPVEIREAFWVWKAERDGAALTEIRGA